MSHLDHLRTFVEVYRDASFSKAAGRLGITQPAVSAHIAALESFVARPLFVRQARGVAATAAADELARSVGPLLDGLEAKLASYRPAGAPGSTLRLTGPSDFIHTGFAAGIEALLAAGYRLRIDTGNRERIYALLESSAVDLAITGSMPNGRTQGYAELLTEHFLSVLSPQLARGLASRPTERQLTALPLIAYDEDLPLVRQAWTARFRHAPPLQASLTIPDLRAICTLVARGVGWSVLPDYLCHEAIATGKLVSLTPFDDAPCNTLYLVWNQSALRNRNIIRARDLLLDVLAQPRASAGWPLPQ